MIEQQINGENLGQTANEEKGNSPEGRAATGDTTGDQQTHQHHLSRQKANVSETDAG